MSNTSFHPSQIKSFGYRRGHIILQLPAGRLFDTFDAIDLPKAIRNKIYAHLRREMDRLNIILYDYLKNYIPSVGKWSNAINNKLVHFMQAKKLGIKTPCSYICTDKISLLQHVQEAGHKAFVLKSISDALTLTFLTDENTSVECILYTEQLDHNLLDTIPETFFPSLLQEKLDKKYEIRTFYLHGDFFSMAIFSQNDAQTRIDFRKYNYKKPNRFVPYRLPKKLANRLRQFMKTVNLNTGSIDMVVTQDDDYYFLEVNPVGQFGMVSIPCNYHLEKRIAMSLM